MLAITFLVLIAGAIVIISVTRFVFALRKLTSGQPDTRGRETLTRQDKPPLVFWAVASTLLAAACVMIVILAIN